MRANWINPSYELSVTLRLIGIGATFIHGFGKLANGAGQLGWHGEQMSLIEINFASLFWCLLASLIEPVGGLLLVTGLLTRFSFLMLVLNMALALV